MEPQERAEYEHQSSSLKLDLKKWETTWAKDHQGNKPARDDIKQNPVIGLWQTKKIPS